jgi:DNA-binding NtrC family response regulator
MTKHHQCYNKNLSTTSPASPKHGLSLGDAPVGSEAHALLMQYSEPGNVRELENAIEHAIVIGLTDEILPRRPAQLVARGRAFRIGRGALPQHSEPDEKTAGPHRAGRNQW